METSGFDEMWGDLLGLGVMSNFFFPPVAGVYSRFDRCGDTSYSPLMTVADVYPKFDKRLGDLPEVEGTSHVVFMAVADAYFQAR